MTKPNWQTLLERQLKKHGLNSASPPTCSEAWADFLERVGNTYREFETSRQSSDNILEVSLCEMERLQNEYAASAQGKLELALAESQKNERSFREVFDNVPVGIIKLGPNLEFISVNAGFEKMLGYTQQELTKLTLCDLSCADKCTGTNCKYFRGNDKNSKPFEMSLKSKTGNEIWSRVTGHSVIPTGPGEPYFLAVLKDISDLHAKEIELHEAENLQKESENYLRVVLDSIQQGVWGLDLNGQITFINERAVKLLGYSNANELLGKAMHNLAEGPMYDSLRNGNKHHVQDDVLWRKDKTSFPISYYSAPIIVENSCIGAVVSFEDLTEQKRLEHDLDTERLKSIRNSKLASLGEMSAGIAHEVNNPLAVISSTIEIIPELLGEPELLLEKVAAVKKSCDRISRIVSGLKKFSRTNENSVYATHSLAAIAKESLVLTESKSKTHYTPVTVEAASSASIQCDEVEIEQVLINLINNAIDAIKDRPERWVKVMVFEEGSCVVLRVIDSGAGIPEATRKKLFEPFFTTKKAGEGTGLGLSITRGILKEHKASISIVSDFPNTCFEIRFPKLEIAKIAA